MTSDQTTKLSITAPDDVETDRLDRYLTTNLEASSLSRTRLKALILEGALTQNGVVVGDPSQNVRANAVYVLTLPPVRDPTPAGQDIPLDIMFEDQHLIVINKPVGMVVHPGPGQPDGTLVNALINHCGPSLTGIGGVMRPGIVHRLDKDTSGVMLAAKTEIAHHRLTEMFAAHDLDRRYQALVWGSMIDREGRVDEPIGRSNRDRKKQAVMPNGRSAATNWQSLRQFPPFASLLECRLETGRTHQIRVHMAHMGHGVIGDAMYGRAPRSGQMPDAVSREVLAQIRTFGRQALHAAQLNFAHPVRGEPMAFETAIPDDMANLIRVIEAGIHKRATTVNIR
ncbi:RluA family pseudouridine synthase [Alphaproteobacteria bacterium]|jgi:23S rRNA pseudouridine1911/1915/1917 synthase|nr:RluA family pseudouridine synthase [Alphaproteobacteria bacterium]NCF48781.1 RluA family pseudouridine synthase [Bacteroidota bacterium]